MATDYHAPGHKITGNLSKGEVKASSHVKTIYDLCNAVRNLVDLHNNIDLLKLNLEKRKAYDNYITSKVISIEAIIMNRLLLIVNMHSCLRTKSHANKPILIMRMSCWRCMLVVRNS